MNVTLDERLLLILGKMTVTDHEVAEAEEIINNPNFAIEQFFRLMFEHRVATFVYHNLVRFNLKHKISRKYRHVLDIYVHNVAERYSELNKIIEQLFEFFQKANVSPVVLKGTMLNETLYKEFGPRYCNDIDLLVKENELDHVCNILKSTGFTQGFYVSKDDRIVPATRKQEIFQKMTTHEVVGFLKRLSNPVYGVVSVDVQFDIFSRSKNMRRYVDLGHLFDHLECVETGAGVSLNTLKAEHNILQLAAHIYSDAVRIPDILSGKDGELYKYTDLYEFVIAKRDQVDWIAFASQLVDMGISDIVYFACHHTEQLFGQFVPSELMTMIKPEKLDILNQYGFEEEKHFTWELSFPDRFFRPDIRRQEVLRLSDLDIKESKKYLDFHAARKAQYEDRNRTGEYK